MKIAYLPRQALVTVNSGVAVSSGSVFGSPKQIAAFTRITGIASIVGSMTFRFQTSLAEVGPVVVSSTWVVNSGPTYLDVPNYGSWLQIDCTAASTLAPTQAMMLAVYGDPVR